MYLQLVANSNHMKQKTIPMLFLGFIFSFLGLNEATNFVALQKILMRNYTIQTTLTDFPFFRRNISEREPYLKEEIELIDGHDKSYDVCLKKCYIIYCYSETYVRSRKRQLPSCMYFTESDKNFFFVYLLCVFLLFMQTFLNTTG